MKMTSKITLLGAALAVGALGAQAAESAEIWVKNCAACHGKDGAGHTKAGHMAKVKDMTDAKYQKSFTNEEGAKRIKEGFKDSSGKERMKAFGDVLSDAEITALVGYVRSLQK